MYTAVLHLFYASFTKYVENHLFYKKGWKPPPLWNSCRLQTVIYRSKPRPVWIEPLLPETYSRFCRSSDVKIQLLKLYIVFSEKHRLTYKSNFIIYNINSRIGILQKIVTTQISPRNKNVFFTSQRQPVSREYLRTIQHSECFAQAAKQTWAYCKERC